MEERKKIFTFAFQTQNNGERYVLTYNSRRTKKKKKKREGLKTSVDRKIQPLIICLFASWYTRD